MVLFWARAARRTCAFAGVACMGSGALSPGPGCTDGSVRAVPEEAQRPKNLAQPLLAGFASPCRFRKASPRKARPGTRRDRAR